MQEAARKKCYACGHIRDQYGNCEWCIKHGWENDNTPLKIKIERARRKKQ